MAKSKVVYAPGELDRVRSKLGDLNKEEAQKMARLLGGEVGYERTDEEEAAMHHKSRRETVELFVKGQPPKRRVEVIGPDAGEAAPAASPAEKKDTPAAPAARLKISYFERLKMDRYAALPEFDIKTPMQAMVSTFSLFNEPPDYVSPLFVTKRIGDYYKRIEQLVISTRTLFPRNNAKRSERLRKASPFAYSILETIRYWNIERITSDMSKIQSHPRSAKVSEFADILRAIYKPLFVMELLDTEAHIKGAYKILYKVLYIENPAEAKKYQDLIRTALSSFSSVRRDVHFLLYPLLMKTISDCWFSYERFFTERRRFFLAFLRASERERIQIGDNAQPANLDNAASDSADQASLVELADGDQEAEQKEEEAALEAARNTEQKSLEHGLATLELLFPKAGWDKLSGYPDLYPYFATTLKLKKTHALIAPTDPMQQIAVLMHILQEFFMALRYVTFGVITGSDGNPVRVEDYMGSIINNWQRYIDTGLNHEYLPRLSEYCQALEQSPETQDSAFIRRITNEINWTKRFYFLPYYKFDTIGPPPIQKRDTIPIYAEVRLLRKYLAAVAAGIEQGNSQGGAQTNAPCEGIDNPWEPYNFEIANPISMRLDMLLSPKKKNNAALIYFSLSVAIVLDYLVNNESSWAYEDRPGHLFRSANNEGVIPLFGVDEKLDADSIFKQVLRQKQKEREQGQNP